MALAEALEHFDWNNRDEEAVKCLQLLNKRCSKHVQLPTLPSDTDPVTRLLMAHQYYGHAMVTSVIIDGAMSDFKQKLCAPLDHLHMSGMDLEDLDAAVQEYCGLTPYHQAPDPGSHLDYILGGPLFARWCLVRNSYKRAMYTGDTNAAINYIKEALHGT